MTIATIDMVIDEKFSFEIPDYGEKKNGVKIYEGPALLLVLILEEDENVSPTVKDILLNSKRFTSKSLWYHPRVGPHLQAAYTSFEVFKTWWDSIRSRRRKKMAGVRSGTPSNSTVHTSRTTIPRPGQTSQRLTQGFGAFQATSSGGNHFLAPSSGEFRFQAPSSGGFRFQAPSSGGFHF